MLAQDTQNMLMTRMAYHDIDKAAKYFGRGYTELANNEDGKTRHSQTRELFTETKENALLVWIRNEKFRTE
jgi:hypothetical protein